MPALKLVRHGAAPMVLRDLEADITFLSLGKLIESSFGFQSFTLTAGFPPKQIEFVPQQQVFEVVPRSSAVHVTEAPATSISTSLPCTDVVDNTCSSADGDIGAVGDTAAAGGLACPTCTFVNAAGRTQCEMCGTPLHSTRAPAPALAPAPAATATATPVMVRRVVPADNSCLFASVAYLLERDRTKAPLLRQIVADAVRADPATFCDAVLERPNAAYCEWILRPESWGGAIELRVLAAHYGVELCAVDVETGKDYHFLPRADGAGAGTARAPQGRAFLVYTGIHYDPVVLALDGPTASEAADVHVLPLDNTDAVQMTKGVADELRRMKDYVNLERFELQCLVCGAGLRGQDDAVKHATETGHQNFGQMR